MQRNPLVSVVIPIYKVERYLEKSVLSVINQTYRNIEIILVDDGSPDNCPQICDNLALKYENIRVIHKVNSGLAEARNSGIDLINGVYLLFLDSDDTLLDNAVEGLVMKGLESDADIVISDRYIQIDEKTLKTAERFHFDDACLIDDPTSFVINVMIGKGRAWRATSLLYKADIIRNFTVRFPAGQIAEDFAFNINFLRYAKRIAYYRKSTLNYLKRAGSTTTTFHANLERAYLFIDDEINKFLDEKNCNNDFCNTKRKELLCRNIISYITDIFSKKCTLKTESRYKKADELFGNDKIRDAFDISDINPYFNNWPTVVYFKIMFKLIQFRKRKTAYMLARLASKFMR